MPRHYIPARGDFVVLTFNPQSGHEQKGRRPAIIISNKVFNKATGLAVACPITNTDRKVPLHVPVPAESTLSGFIMVEQVKSIDYKTRELKFVEKAPDSVLNAVLGILDACLYQDG